MTSHTGSLRDALEERGYRITAPRLRLLQTVMDNPDHFSAEEVRAGTPAVGRATVYRTIKLLVELGVLCKMAMEDGAPRYRLASRTHHHHLICVRCGSTEDFARCGVDYLIDRLQQATGYRALGHRIEVYGVCATCQEAEPHIGDGESWL